MLTQIDFAAEIAKLKQHFKPRVIRRPLADWVHKPVCLSGVVSVVGRDFSCITDLTVWCPSLSDEVRSFDHLWVETADEFSQLEVGARVFAYGKVKKYFRVDGRSDYSIIVLPCRHLMSMLERLKAPILTFGRKPDKAVELIGKLEALTLFIRTNNVFIPAGLTVECVINWINTAIESHQRDLDLQRQYDEAAKSRNRKKPSNSTWITLNRKV